MVETVTKERDEFYEDLVQRHSNPDSHQQVRKRYLCHGVGNSRKSFRGRAKEVSN